MRAYKDPDLQLQKEQSQKHENFIGFLRDFDLS